MLTPDAIASSLRGDDGDRRQRRQLRKRTGSLFLSGGGKGKALNGLNVAREQAAGLIDVAGSQCLQNQPVILVGPRSPAGTSRHCEHQPRICKLQSIEAGEQARHRAGRNKRVVKGAVGHFKILNCLGIISFNEGELDPCQMGRRQLWSRIAQCDDLERGAHLGDLLHRLDVERSNPHAMTGSSYDKVLGFQLPKGLADRNVTGIELPRDMILPERSVWLQRAGDNALTDRVSDAAGDRRVLVHHHRLSTRKTNAFT